MKVTATFWDKDVLRIRGDDQTDIPWTPGLNWNVGDDQTPRDIHECVFEPRCLRLGEPCACPIGLRPHVVYAAFYGTMAKVGMTTAARLEGRLREQGADAGFVIAKCPGRGAARRTEKDVTFMHNIPQWRTRKEKFPWLTKPVPWDAIEETADALRGKLQHHFDPGPRTVRIEPTLPVLDARPHAVESAGRHEGTVVGAKGTYIFYRPAGLAGRLAVGKTPVLALKHTDLVGRELTLL